MKCPRCGGECVQWAQAITMKPRGRGCSSCGWREGDPEPAREEGAVLGPADAEYLREVNRQMCQWREELEREPKEGKK